MASMFDQNSENELSAEEALGALVGEGKKYATPQELAKAMLHAQTHISVIESENADLRSRSDNSKAIQEALERLTSGQHQQQAPAPDQSKAPDVDVAKTVQELLADELGKREQAANRQQVIQHFKQEFGGKAGEMFGTMAKELGFTVEQLENYAATNPQALIGLTGKLLTVQHHSAASLSGNRAPGGDTGSTAAPSTKSEILKRAKEENWPAKKKYEILHREMARAGREGRLDTWNR